MTLFGSQTVTNPDLLQVPIDPLTVVDSSGKRLGSLSPVEWSTFIQTLSRVTSNPSGFSSGTGTNYIPRQYAQFSDGALPTMSGTATIAYDTGFSLFGLASLKVTGSGTVYFSASATTYDIAIAPSQTWIISAYCKASTVSSPGTIGITTAVGTYTVPYTASPVAGNVVRIFGVLDLSSDTSTQATIEIDSTQGAGNNTWFDGFMLEPQSGTSDNPSPFNTNTPPTNLNTSPSGGVVNDLPHLNSSVQTQGTISSTVDANGNYLQAGSTTVLIDDAGLGNTANWGNVANIPNTLTGHNLSGIAQPILETTSGTKHIWASDTGGPIYETVIYGPEINCYGEAGQPTVVLSGSTGVFTYIGNIVDLGNPGVPVGLIMMLRGGMEFNAITSNTEVFGEFEYSTNGGSTWTTAGGTYSSSSLSGTFIFPYVDYAFVSLGAAPTGNIQIRYKIERTTGTTGTLSMVNSSKFGLLLPNASGAVIGGTLAASLPGTATDACSVVYPSTTCQPSKSITVTYSGGLAPIAFSNAIVSGGTDSGATISSGATSQTFTVKGGSQTATSGGATFTAECHSVVTDSTTPTPQQVTTNTCTITETYTLDYSAISASMSTTNGSCSTGLVSGNCSANGSFSIAASGGNGSYTYSNSITSQTSGYSATITAGATSASGTVAGTHATTLLPGNTDTVNLKSVVNDTRSTGAVNATGSLGLTYKFIS